MWGWLSTGRGFGRPAGGSAGTIGPMVLLRSELRAAGYTDHEVARLRRRGELVPVRRGAYLRGGLPVDPVQQHLNAIRAAVAQLGPWAVVSHVSAAVLHGWGTWAIPLDRVWVARPKRSAARTTGNLQVRSAPLGPEEIGCVDGIAVTSAARTVVDLARTVGFEQAVIIADQALARGAVGDDGLRAALVRAAGWWGVPAARRAVQFADAGSGSVGESRSRVAIARAGLPAPELQWRVGDRRGGHVGTVDFGWREQCTVGEFDGLVKYGRLLSPGQTAADAVVAEKLREDALRAQGLTVVRWTWRNLADFTPTADRLRHHLAAGARTPAGPFEPRF